MVRSMEQNGERISFSWYGPSSLWRRACSGDSLDRQSSARWVSRAKAKDWVLCPSANLDNRNAITQLINSTVASLPDGSGNTLLAHAFQ